MCTYVCSVITTKASSHVSYGDTLTLVTCLSHGSQTSNINLYIDHLLWQTMRNCLILIIFVLTMFCKKCTSLIRLPGFSAKTQLNRMVSARMVSTDYSPDLQSMKGDLLNLLTSTARGANDNNKMEISRMIDSFAAAKSDVSNPIRTEDLVGEWELLYTDDDITR